jgi:hypothetical protein
VTEYTPADRPEIEAPVAPLLHEKDFEPVPPVAVAVAVPEPGALQVAWVEVTETVSAVGLPNVTLLCAKQLLASVTVTAYEPAANPEMDEVVWPVFQE